MEFFEGERVPVPLPAGPSFGLVRSSAHAFPAAAPIIPPPVPRWFPFRSLCRRGPNHALQRTEAGHRAFLHSRALRGQPLSLSLGPLGEICAPSMNEWILQDSLTTKWATEGPTIPPFGRLTLVAWELMFPSWDINHSSTRWNEPSIDFVFLTDAGAFVLLELKHIVTSYVPFLSAFCQVTHRASRFVSTYSRERLLHAHSHCEAGACGRQNEAFQLLPLATAPDTISFGAVHRVIGAVSFPRSADTLLARLNQASFPDLITELASRSQNSREFRRFRELAPTDYAALAASPVHVLSVGPISPNNALQRTEAGRRASSKFRP